MIVFTSERCRGASVVHLDGSFEPTDDPTKLVKRILDDSGSNPVVVDLSGVEPLSGPEVAMLLRLLAATPKRDTTVLVHPDLETRRTLRARSNGLPVLPSGDLALHGRFASTLVAHEQQPDR